MCLILIAKDHSDQHRELEAELTNAHINHISCANDPLDISISIEKYHPSLVLFNSSKLGFEAIQELFGKEETVNNRFDLINIYTYEDPEELMMLAKLGINQCYPFPYDPKMLMCYIRRLCLIAYPNKEDFSRTISQGLSDLMDTLVKSRKQRGKLYIRDAVLMLLFDYPFKVNLHKEIYARLAENYQTSVKSIEHSIRITIKSCWQPANKDILGSCFDCDFTDKDRPSNYSFILALAHHIYFRNSDYFAIYRTQKNKTGSKLHI